jgi:hypothetical protein
MSYWSETFVDGIALDLSHLEPFEFTVLPADADIHATVSVRFNDHCFSEDFDAAKHKKLFFTNQSATRERRGFSAERYELSKLLPAIIRDLDGKKIGYTRAGNLVRVTLADGRVYPMFFTLKLESRRRILMFVVSAYDWNRPGWPADTGEMKFNIALAKVLREEKPRFPPR